MQDGLSQDFKRGQLAWVSLGGLASAGTPGAFGLGAVQNPGSGEINTPAWRELNAAVRQRLVQTRSQSRPSARVLQKFTSIEKLSDLMFFVLSRFEGKIKESEVSLVGGFVNSPEKVTLRLS